MLGDALEADIVTALAAAVTAGGAGYSIAAGATALTDSKIRQAIQILGEQNVVDWENTTLFVNPDGFNDLMAETRYSSSDFIMDNNGKPVVSGRVLVVYGVEVRVSNNVPAGFAYLAHKDSVAVAVQSNVSVKGWDNVRSGAWEQRSEMIYGVKEQRTNTAVKIAFV